MKHIIRGIERLSNEKRRSGSFDRGSLDVANDAGPLDQELCLQLVVDLHGVASEVAVARLLQAAASVNSAHAKNRATIVRAGAVVPLVELIRVASGSTHADARNAVLQVLLALAEHVGDGSVHCQLAFVGVVESLMPLLKQEGSAGATRGPQLIGSRRNAFPAHLLALSLARSVDGLDSVIRGGAAVYLVRMLKAHERGCIFEHVIEAAHAIIRFHHHLSNDRLVEFATDIQYAALLQMANSTARAQIHESVQSLWSADMLVAASAAASVLKFCKALPELHTELISSGVIPAMRNILNSSGHPAAGHARQTLAIVQPDGHDSARSGRDGPEIPSGTALSHNSAAGNKAKEKSPDGDQLHPSSGSPNPNEAGLAAGICETTVETTNVHHADSVDSPLAEDVHSDSERIICSVVVIEAVDLGGHFKHASLSVTIKFRGQEKSTSVCESDCRHPSWNERLDFQRFTAVNDDSRSSRFRTLLVTLSTSTSGTGKEDVGVGTFDISQCLAAQDCIHEDWVTVNSSIGSNSATAMIKLSCHVQEGVGTALLDDRSAQISYRQCSDRKLQNEAASIIQNHFLVWKRQRSSNVVVARSAQAEKNNGIQLHVSEQDTNHLPVDEVFDIDETKIARPCPEGWETAISRSTGRLYFINIETGESQYEYPVDLSTESGGASSLLHRIYDSMTATKRNVLYLFNVFDSAVNGSLTAEEFSEALEKLSIEFNHTELEAAVHCMDTDNDGRFSKSNFLDSMRLVKEQKTTGTDTVTQQRWSESLSRQESSLIIAEPDDGWEEIDLVFEKNGSLGLVFSSETESTAKVVTEIIPGRLASRVQEIRSSFDDEGRPLVTEPALALVSVQDQPVAEMGFTEAVDLIRDASRPLRMSLRRVPWSAQMVKSFQLHATRRAQASSRVLTIQARDQNKSMDADDQQDSRESFDAANVSHEVREKETNTGNTTSAQQQLEHENGVISSLLQLCSEYVQKHSQKVTNASVAMQTAALTSQIKDANSDSDVLAAILSAAQAENVALRSQLEATRQDNVELRTELDRLVGNSGPAASWGADETLVWFGRTFSFADRYIERFAALDIDAATLRHMTSKELLDEIGIESAIHRRRVLEHIALRFSEEEPKGDISCARVQPQPQSNASEAAADIDDMSRTQEFEKISLDGALPDDFANIWSGSSHGRRVSWGDEEVYEFVIPDEERRVKQRAAAPSLRKADSVRSNPHKLLHQSQFTP